VYALLDAKALLAALRKATIQPYRHDRWIRDMTTDERISDIVSECYLGKKRGRERQQVPCPDDSYRPVAHSLNHFASGLICSRSDSGSRTSAFEPQVLIQTRSHRFRPLQPRRRWSCRAGEEMPAILLKRCSLAHHRSRLAGRPPVIRVLRGAQSSKPL
jgi:hypothetical protein